MSTTDIAFTIKELLAQSEKGRTAIIGVEDIKVLEDVGEGVEGERLKALGDFEIEVRVKGGEAIRRIASVRDSQS